jgi:rSAM/selenodomain-associated transferase 2
MLISIIIPTLNEAAMLPATLASLGRQEGDLEIVVCDGGSTDGTVEIAHDAGATIVSTTCGRGQQLRAGAAQAKGDVLVFLHADTVLAPGAVEAVEEALAAPTIAGGNFRVLFDGPSDFAAWLTSYYGWLRSHALYYGDSVIFLRRSVYDAIGGIKPIALMEDYDLVRRLEAFGPTICIGTPPVITSSRRFEGRRPWRIYAQWVMIHALYHLRVRPGLLARLYRSAAHRPALDH